MEDKHNDYKTINVKNKAWDILSEEFNSQANEHKRDPKQLKKLLEKFEGPCQEDPGERKARDQTNWWWEKSSPYSQQKCIGCGCNTTQPS